MPSLLRTAEKGTFLDPGMWPEGMPVRGSGALPSKRPGDRASTTASAPESMLASRCSADRTRSPCSESRRSSEQGAAPASGQPWGIGCCRAHAFCERALPLATQHSLRLPWQQQFHEQMRAANVDACWGTSNVKKKQSKYQTKKPEISHVERRAVAAGGGRAGHPARCGVHLVVRRWRRVHGQVRACPRWEAAVQDRHPASQEN